MLTLTPQRTKSTSSKSTEQTMQPLGLSLSQIQNPAVVVVVVVVAVAGAEAVEVVGESRNKGTDPLMRRLQVMDRLAKRGNAALNLMVVHTPERGVLRYQLSGQRRRRQKRTREIRDRHGWLYETSLLSPKVLCCTLHFRVLKIMYQ